MVGWCDKIKPDHAGSRRAGGIGDGASAPSHIKSQRTARWDARLAPLRAMSG